MPVFAHFYMLFDFCQAVTCDMLHSAPRTIGDFRCFIIATFAHQHGMKLSVLGYNVLHSHGASRLLQGRMPGPWAHDRMQR
eukprot:5336659-Amphidinium_carterae.1